METEMDIAKLTAPRNLSILEVLHARVCYSGFHLPHDARRTQAVRRTDACAGARADRPGRTQRLRQVDAAASDRRRNRTCERISATRRLDRHARPACG